jgi:hypothetical protein
MKNEEMSKVRRAAAVLVVLATALAGCGDDDGDDGRGGAGAGGDGPSGPTTSSAGGGDAASTSASTAAGGGEGGAGAGGGEGGAGGGGEGGAGGAAPVCTQAREDALGPIDAVSEGEVSILEDEPETTVFVDASAGGIQDQATNPWIYVDLDAVARAEVTDVTADASDAWDLALKRPILRVNGGDGGLAGQGRAAFVDADFDDVTSDDVADAAWREERWFDEECTLQTDPTGAIATSFDGWYLYEDMTVTPAPGTWLVRSGDGAQVFKVAILAYYANPDGSPGQAGGRYVLRVGEVTP